jgi:glycosyltransferase involved in cell wall biosynthesis
MKVLHLVKTAVGATWVYEQVRVLRSAGVDVVVALPSATQGMAPKYRELGVAVERADIDFPAKRPWLLPTRLQACRSLVRHVNPDLIHTHHVGTTLVTRFALGRKSPIPRIFQVAGPLHLEHPLFSRLDICTAGPQDHWIATCEWTRRKYQEHGIPADRIFSTYAGTDIKLFRRKRTGQLRQQLGLASDTPLVGMVCYMYPPKRYLGQTRGLKGHEDFFAALRLARRARPEIRGVVIGGAWNGHMRYEQRLRRLGARLCKDSLAFLGTRDDVPSLYPDLDLAVVASHSENVGGAVEPLLCGVPVIATDVGGLPDLVIPGKTGWLVPARNPKLLAKAMLEALENRDQARERALAGQTLARTMFDVDRTARHVLAAYQNVLSPTAKYRKADWESLLPLLDAGPPDSSHLHEGIRQID